MLNEILESRVVSSRGRHNPRAVKRKVSKFPTRSRSKRTLPTQTHIGVEVVK